MRLRLSVAFAALLAIVGCSSDDGESAGTTVPIEESDGSLYDFTSTIRITEDGFLPFQATAVFDQVLTFVNETDRVQTIQFTNGSPAVGGPQTMGPIPPGESVSWPDPLSTAASLLYESDDLPGQTGHLQIGPGEIP